MRGLTPNFILLSLLFVSALSPAQTPQLGLPLGFSSGLYEMEFSEDDKYFLTVSGHNDIQLFEVASGALIRTFANSKKEDVEQARLDLKNNRIIACGGNHGIWIYDIFSGKMIKELAVTGDYFPNQFISKDLKYVATQDHDFAVIVLNTFTGDTLVRFPGSKQQVYHLSLSNDNRLLFINYLGSYPIIIDTKTGQIKHILRAHGKQILDARFSPDNRFLATASHDGYAAIHDLKSGRIHKQVSFDSKSVRYVRFSPDGSSLAISANGEMRLLNLEKGTEQKFDFGKGHFNAPGVSFHPDGKLFTMTLVRGDFGLNETSTGKLLRTYEGPSPGGNSMLFSHDGKTLAIRKGLKVHFYDYKSETMLAEAGGSTLSTHSVLMHPDGSSYFTENFDRRIQVYDFRTGELVFTSPPQEARIKSSEYSADGRWIVVCSADSTVRFYDSKTGKIEAQIKSEEYQFREAKMSPDMRFVGVESAKKGILIYDTYTTKLVQTYGERGPYYFDFAFSPNSDKLIISQQNKITEIYDVQSGNFLDKVVTEHEVFKIKFYDNGRKVLLSNSTYDLATKELVHLKETSKIAWVRDFTPDGKYVLITNTDSMAHLFNLQTGKVEAKYSSPADLTKLSIHPQKDEVVFACTDGSIRIHHLKTGALKHKIGPYNMTPHTAFYSVEGKYLITATLSGVLMVYSADNYELIYTSFILKDGESWLAVDRDFRFDGSENVRKQLYLTCGLEVIELDRMKDALYVPKLVSKLVKGLPINYPKIDELNICRALPIIEHTVGQGSYAYTITARSLGLDAVDIYVNGKRLRTLQASSLKRDGNKYFINLNKKDLEKYFMPGQENVVRVYGVVKQNGNELRSRGAVVKAVKTAENSIKPKLYAVMIGVDDYKGSDLDLQFPSKDAQAVGDAIQKSAEKFLGKENVIMYHINSDENSKNLYNTPEKAGIRSAFEDIGKQAQPQDLVIVFFAGHGVMQGETDKKFTLLTSESSSSNSIGVSTTDLMEWLSPDGPFKMKPNKTILILDACNSGQVAQELLALARNDEETQRLKQVEDLKDKSGLFILAASAPDQSAYEIPQYGHGLLSYSLLKTLKSNPDILDNGLYLNAQEWFLKTTKELELLTASRGINQQAQPFGTSNIRIGTVDDEVRNSITLLQEKPLVICSNVLNISLMVDNLGLKKMVNNKLLEAVSRGSDFELSRAESGTAIQINLGYMLLGDKVQCTLTLMLKGELRHTKVLNGDKARLEELVDEIVEEIEGRI